MKRFILTNLLLLSACMPIFTPHEGQVSFVAEGGELFFVSNVGMNIGRGSALVTGNVTSQHVAFQNGDMYALELTEGDYGTRVRVGRYLGPVSGEATITLVGGRAALEVPLQVR